MLRSEIWGISNNQHFPQIVIENVKMISRTIAKPQTFAEKQVASLLKILLEM